MLGTLAEAMTNKRSSIKAWIESAAEIRDTLAGPTPSPLEWLVCEQVAIAWLDWTRCSMTRDVGENWRLTDKGKGNSMKRTEYLDKRVDRAHRRLLGSLKVLANIRRLDITNIQINMGAER